MPPHTQPGPHPQWGYQPPPAAPVRQPGRGLSTPNLWALIIAVLGVIFVAMFIATAIGQGHDTSEDGKAGDVEITSCNVDDGGLVHDVRISYTVTNSAQVSRAYTIEFTVQDADGARVGRGSEYVKVDPGEKVRGEKMIVADAAGGVRCYITDVA